MCGNIKGGEMSTLVSGLICIILAIVGCGVAAWLYSMTDAGETQKRGHKLGFW